MNNTNQTRIIFIDWLCGFGTRHRHNANTLMKSEGITMECFSDEYILNNLETMKNCDAIVFAHQYDGRSIMELINLAPHEFPMVFYVHPSGVKISIPDYYENVEVIHGKFSELTEFVDVFRKVAHRLREIYEDMPALEDDSVDPVVTVGIPFYELSCGTYDHGQLYKEIENDHRMRSVAAGTKNQLLRNFEEIDIVILKFEGTQIDEDYQKALDVIDKPVYVLYCGELKDAREAFTKVNIDAHQMLNIVSGCEDFSEIINAIYEHYTDKSMDHDTIQDIYDNNTNNIVRHVWIGKTMSAAKPIFLLRSSPSFTFSSGTDLISITYTGSKSKVASAIDDITYMIAGGFNPSLVIADTRRYAIQKFVASFVEQQRSLGKDWHEGAYILVKMCNCEENELVEIFRDNSDYFRLDL